MRPPLTENEKIKEFVITNTCVYANGDKLVILRDHKYEGGSTCEVLSMDAPFNGKLSSYIHPDSLRSEYSKAVCEPRQVGLEIIADVFCVHICENREAAMRIINQLLGTSYA